MCYHLYNHYKLKGKKAYNKTIYREKANHWHNHRMWYLMVLNFFTYIALECILIYIENEEMRLKLVNLEDFKCFYETIQI